MRSPEGPGAESSGKLFRTLLTVAGAISAFHGKSRMGLQLGGGEAGCEKFCCFLGIFAHIPSHQGRACLSVEALPAKRHGELEFLLR